MITLQGKRTNFGFGFPDVNYNGVSLIGGYNPASIGLSGISLSSPLTLAAIAAVAYFAWKNKAKLGF